MPRGAPKPLDSARALALLDSDELAALPALLGVTDAAQLQRLPLHQVLTGMLRLRSPFVAILRQIVELLERLEAYIQGNARALLLADQAAELSLDFGPQLRRTLAEVEVLQPLADARLDDLGERILACRSLLLRLRANTKAQPVERLNAQGEALQRGAEQLMPGSLERERLELIIERVGTEQVYEFHPRDVFLLKQVRDAFGLTLHRVSADERLQTLAGDASSVLRQSAKDAQALHLDASRKLAHEHPPPRRSQPDSAYFALLRPLQELNERLADDSQQTERAQQVLEFFELHLWRHRWRLYELWLLCWSATALLTRGARIEGRPRIVDERWDLRFSRDSEPVLQLRLGDTLLDLYYQLYQASSAGGDMPDIAVRLRGAGFLLVFDPKHGPSYSRSAMRKVCQRYWTQFAPGLACVMNYFEAAEPIEEVEGDPRRLLLWQLQPASVGLARLDQALEQALHDCLPGYAAASALVVLLDLSPSALPHLSNMLAELQSRLQAERGTGQAWLIGFAQHSAPPRVLVAGADLAALVDSLDKAQLGEGTEVAAALQAAFSQLQTHAGRGRIWLCGDGQGEVDGAAIERQLRQLGATLDLLLFDAGEAPELLVSLEGRQGVRRLLQEGR